MHYAERHIIMEGERIREFVASELVHHDLTERQ